MRGYKFRAWDTSDEKAYMLGPYDLTDAIFNYKNIRRLPLMQFTGLHDKSGKEIYEGDILTEYSIFDNEQPRTITIIWKDGGFMYRNSHNSDFYFYQALADNTEVIGNIYESPELLK